MNFELEMQPLRYQTMLVTIFEHFTWSANRITQTGFYVMVTNAP